ncbi:MAG: SDR family oxidoreductase [Deltaproteobacteria bacterium]|nr:SDR family oxidoreductase [Deltaproteobacteria bacterium]
MLLDGKSALVTGGASGIGRAIATAFVREGASVAVADLNEGAARQAAELLQGVRPPGAGSQVIAQAVDVTKAASVTAMMQAVLKAFGRLDVLVNNAGGALRSLVHEMPEEQWDQVLALNLTGAFLCSRAAVEPMRRQGGGRIINISSNYAFTGSASRAHYAAAKAGILGLTKSLALELAPVITANAIAPGLTNTARVRGRHTEEEWARRAAEVPLGRNAEPEDIARGAVFLASDLATFVTGQTLHVNGGLIMP